MKNMRATFITEIMKLRRSKIVFITICLFIFIPVMMGLLMLLAQHPEVASKLGIVAAKANFFTENTWSGYFEIIHQTIAAIGMVGFGFVITWIFGREYIEHTITDILALPVTRSSIVISKFITAALWCTALIIVLYGTSLVVGFLIGIPGWSIQVFKQSLYIYIMTSYLTLFVSTPVAFFTGLSRGIIAPIGFVILSLIMANFIVVVGLGPYFPWSVPGILTVSQGTKGLQLVPASYIILAITSLIGFVGTISWWRLADHH